MGRHSAQQSKTVADLVAALQKIDQSLPVHEPWDDLPGWFEVIRVETKDTPDGEFTTVDEYVVLGIFLDSAYAQMYDHVVKTEEPRNDHQLSMYISEDERAFGGLKLPEGYDRDDWPYGD